MQKIDNQTYNRDGKAEINTYLNTATSVVNDYVDKTNIFKEQYANTKSDDVKENIQNQYNELADKTIKMLEANRKFLNIFDENGMPRKEEISLKVKSSSVFSELYSIFEEKAYLEKEWDLLTPDEQDEKEEEYREKFSINKTKKDNEFLKIKIAIQKINFCINSIQKEKNNPNTLKHPSEYQPLIENNDNFVLPKGKLANVNKKRISKLGVAFVLVGVGTMIALPIAGRAVGLALASGFGAAAVTSTVGSVLSGVFGFGGFSLGSLITYGAYSLQTKMTDMLNTPQNISKMTEKKFKKYVIKLTSDISKAVNDYIKKNKSIEELKDLKNKCKWRIKTLRDSINETISANNNNQNIGIDIRAKETAIEKIKILVDKLNQEILSIDPNAMREPFFNNLEFTDEELYGVKIQPQNVQQQNTLKPPVSQNVQQQNTPQSSVNNQKVKDLYNQFKNKGYNSKDLGQLIKECEIQAMKPTSNLNENGSEYYKLVKIAAEMLKSELEAEEENKKNNTL